MSDPWTAEVSISAELARALIAEQFPQLAPDRVDLLGVGWDNSAFLVDGETVFRFPRRQMGADLLENEIRVLPMLASRLPLAVPNPKYVGRATDRFPWDFAGYRRLGGRTACALVMSDLQRIAAATMIASFLAALHSLPLESGRKVGVPGDTLGRLDAVRRVPQAHERVEKLEQQGLLVDGRRYHRLIDETGHARLPRETSLVHGDLYVRHLMVSEDALPCGVIDWGDVHLGDIALDLSIAHSFLPPAGHDVFRNAYGPIDESTWQLARFRALTYGLILTLYGHSVMDADLVREGRLMLRYVLQE